MHCTRYHLTVALKRAGVKIKFNRVRQMRTRHEKSIGACLKFIGGSLRDMKLSMSVQLFVTGDGKTHFKRKDHKRLVAFTDKNTAEWPRALFKRAELDLRIFFGRYEKSIDTTKKVSYPSKICERIDIRFFSKKEGIVDHKVLTHKSYIL